MPVLRRYLPLFSLLLPGMVVFAAGLWAAVRPAQAGAPVILPTPPCGPGWNVVATPNSGSLDNSLTGVSILSSTDVWAVGFYTDTGVTKTLTERWNGTSWAIVSSPNVGAGNNSLQAVSARSATDVWAVGFYADSGSINRTLILHYDGSTWTQTASPSPGAAENYLYGVSYVSATDAWAVGFDSDTTNLYKTLTLRWNGTTWTQVTSPTPFLGAAGLRGVVVVSPTEVWAVGAQADISLTIRSYAIRFNGSTWSAVTTPNTAGCLLAAVAVASAGNLWAAGACQATGSPYQTLILRYNGSAWSTVSSPNPGSGDNALGGLAVVGPNDAWALGGYDNGAGTQTLALHWDGTAWTQGASDNPGSSSNQLVSAAANGSELWAVGAQSSGGPSQTLAEHFVNNAPCATITPTVAASATATSPANTATPVATNTASASTATATHTASAATSTSTSLSTSTIAPPTATATATAGSGSTATSTPTPTSTACAITFSDVPPDNTFYANIRCLACRSILGGYPDGTFRPSNNVTRGQLAKIVSNSAGYTDPQPNQLFEDVAVGSTFHDFIARLASRGFMSGYPCGGQGEPCGSGNLPYFRPSANATRGQISKIVSNAAGFSEAQPNQLFEDVLVGSTFHDFIARLASRGYMNGYPCGGPGEPCGSGNLPYFRPSNNASRGQTAKIVGNTFFPGCVTPAR